MAYLEYFPPHMIELQEEIFNHPELCRLLANHPPQEKEARIAEIATYCGILLNGMYMPEDIDKLCEILHRKLVEKRIQIILPLE